MKLKLVKSDLISGFLVFLIALPLCLGIAKASGFPPIAGIYTAVIGGLIVTFFSNAPLAIKGPAAGLIVIAIGAVDELGGGDPIIGYKLTLAVIVISGLFQIVLGLLKSGKLGDFFPVSVIHGMLAAIGVIIISKQIHIAIGVVPEGKSTFALLAELPRSFANMNPEVAVIGFLSLLVLVLHPIIKNRTVKRLPAPLLVLALAIPLGFLFDLSHEHDYGIGSLHFHINPAQLLVALPDNFFNGITFPDFSQIISYTSLKYVVMFTLVGSLESILSAKAVDTLDPKGRKSNLNKDLVAIGIGNTLAGMIGGLPMISEIVRSSANINNGARTRMSNFFHGLFLFLFVLLAASIIQKIPNAALSAMLIYTGFKLAAPAQFKRVKAVGNDQLLQFLTTLVVTLFTDLLVGVLAGIALKVLHELFQGAKVRELLKLDMTVNRISKNNLELKFRGIASFVNYLQFKSFIEKEAKNQFISLDFSETRFVDHTFLNNIHHLQNEFVRSGGELSKKGFDKHHFQSEHHLASRRRITNPNWFKKQETLSLRQRDIKSIADEFGFDFVANASPSLIRPYLSPFSILPRFKRAKNFAFGTRTHYNIMLCDITYEAVDDFSRKSSEATVAIIHNIARGGVPDFYTEKEASLFNADARYDFERIKLKSIPNFHVYGNNSNLLNEFFSDDLLDIVNTHDHDIECQRRVILLHNNWAKISDVQKLKDFLNYTDQFAQQVVSRSNKTSKVFQTNSKITTV